MKPSISRGLAAAAFVALTMLPGEVEARRGGIPIPIVGGHGEKIVHVTDLPPDTRRAVSQELGQDVAVGFYYERVHIFWLDLWTWGGEHVLYRGNNCRQLEPSDWERILPESEREKLGKPFWYRIPSGLAVVIALAFLGFLASRSHASGSHATVDTARARKLLQDERYQQALQVFAKMPRAGPPVKYHRVLMEPAELAFIKAVEYLQSHGIPEEEDKDNIRRILRAIVAEAQESAADS